MLYLIIGGSGSGKSEYAEKVAVNCHKDTSGKLIYIATMRIWDEEGRKRVLRHRNMRAEKGFETIEQFVDLESLDLSFENIELREKPVVLLECMSNLTLNEFYTQESGTKERILQGIKYLKKQCHDLIIVTNDIFSDGVTYDPESERYINLLGQINKELTFIAESVTEVVYGIPIPIS